MIICIAGFAGSGKDTVGAMLAEKLKLKHIRFSFKEEAARRGMPLMEFQKLANKDKSIDLEMDKRIVEEAEKGNCVVTTWLGPWKVKNADLRVWLEASEGERSKRVSTRDNMSAAEALRHIRKRDEDNIKRYKRYYGIDITDKGVFDLIVKSDEKTPEEIAGLIIRELEKRKISA